MPLNNYYRGHGAEVLENMRSEYGDKKGKSVFFATAQKRGLKPAQDGVVAADDPMPAPPQNPTPLSPYDQSPISSQGAVPPMGTSPSMPPMPQSQGMPPAPMPNNPMPGMRKKKKTPEEEALLAQNGPIPPDPTAPPAPQNGRVLNTNPTPPSDINKLEAGETTPGGAIPGEMSQSVAGQPSTSPFQSKIGNLPLDKPAAEANQAYVDAVHKKVPGWKEALGITLSSIGLPQIGNRLSREGQAQGAFSVAQHVGALANQETQQELLKEELENARQNTQSRVEDRAVRLDTLQTNAATRAAAVEASKQHIAELEDAQVRKWVEDQIGKSRMEDSNYLTDGGISKPSGWDFINNPKKPGEGWAVPPNWIPMPEALSPHIPGVAPGTLIPHSQYKQALKDYNAQNLATSKLKDTPPKENEAQWIADSTNPDPAISGPAKAKLAGSARQHAADRPVTNIYNQTQGGAVNPTVANLVEQMKTSPQVYQGIKDRNLQAAVATEWNKQMGLPAPVQIGTQAKTREDAAANTIENLKTIKQLLNDPVVRQRLGPAMGRLGNAEQTVGATMGLSPQDAQKIQRFRSALTYLYLGEGKQMFGGRPPEQLMSKLEATSPKVAEIMPLLLGSLSAIEDNSNNALMNAERQRFGGKTRDNFESGLSRQFTKGTGPQTSKGPIGPGTTTNTFDPDKFIQEHFQEHTR